MEKLPLLSGATDVAAREAARPLLELLRRRLLQLASARLRRQRPPPTSVTTDDQMIEKSQGEEAGLRGW